jgi:hypothetical protein
MPSTASGVASQLDRAGDVNRRLALLERMVKQLTAARRLQNTTLSAGGLIVAGGDIDVQAGSVNVGNAGPGVSLGFNGASGFISFPGIIAGVELDANIALNVLNPGMPNGRSFLTFSSAIDSTQMDYIALNLFASSADGTGIPQVALAYVDNTGTPWFLLTLDYTGCDIVGTATAVHPGSGGSRSSPAVAETWQPVTFDSTWSAAAASTCAYRLMPDGTVLLKGWVKTTNTALASGASPCTLPAPYWPLQTHAQPVSLESSTTTLQAQISTAGVLTLVFSGTLNAPTLSLDGVRFPVI